MKKYLILALTFLFCSGFLVGHSGPPAGGSSPQNFSDDFATTPFTARFSYLTSNHFTFSTDHIVSATNSAILYNTAASTLNQYFKADKESVDYSPAGVFRSTSTASDGYYCPHVYANNVYWDYCDNTGFVDTIEDMGALNISSATNVAATLCGAQSTPVLKIWINVTNNTPYDCNNWDSASDPADKTSSVTPSAPQQYGGYYIGIGEYQTGISVDNWYGGDVP